MKELTIQIKDDHYKLLLQFLKTLDYVTIASPTKDEPASHQKYDFSDIAGKLEWNGDAILEQRALRNEW